MCSTSKLMGHRNDCPHEITFDWKSESVRGSASQLEQERDSTRRAVAVPAATYGFIHKRISLRYSSRLLGQNEVATAVSQRQASQVRGPGFSAQRNGAKYREIAKVHRRGKPERITLDWTQA